ncbi:MAG: glycosyltransferase family 39 protein [Elainella sp. C42_A2020_010]|nr:glycosyltransferase family 39 protein [Elainella sp. C42_A2020_010]
MDNRSETPKTRKSRTRPLTALSLMLSLMLLALLLSLGVVFRIANLDQKIFWVDEVATAMRASGYTKAEVTAQLTDGSLHSPAELLAYQRLSPDRSLSQTLNALTRSPEHAPLYFLLTRFWMQAFGSTVGAIRSFSVLCSLLVLPCLVWLCQELFRSYSPTPALAPIGSTAAALMAVSPFFVAYAQEARPYSFWLLTIVLCSGALLRAGRRNTWLSWAIYALTLLISLYTSLLTVLLAVGQAMYVFTVQPHRSILRHYQWAIGVALVGFLPWVWVIWHQSDALATNTTWMRTPIQPFAMIAIWLYSFAVLFFDVPVVAQWSWVALLQATIAAMVLTVMGIALYRMAQLPHRVGFFLAALCGPIPFTLILLDLIFQGQASASPRYLIPSQLGVLLAVAYCCAESGLPSYPQKSASETPVRLQRQWLVITAFLLGLSLISAWVNLNRSPDYQKAHNRHNPEIAALVNQAISPILVAEPSQTMNLLSLSHSLSPTVHIQLLPLEQMGTVLSSCQNYFVFNPSPQLVTKLHQIETLRVQQIYHPQLITNKDIHLSLAKTQFAACRAP